MLEWRKLAASDGASTAKKPSSNQDPSFVYSSTIIEEEPEMDEPVQENNSGEEHTQTDFLLGLHNKTDDESESEASSEA